MFSCFIAALKAKEKSAYDQSQCTEGLKKSEVTQNWMLIGLVNWEYKPAFDYFFFS